MLIPILDRIIVRPDATASVSPGGVHIPEACRGADALVRKGEVVAVGPGAPLPDGSARKMQVRLRDTIYFGKGVGIALPAGPDGEVTLVLREEDVLAVVDNSSR